MQPHKTSDEMDLRREFPDHGPIVDPYQINGQYQDANDLNLQESENHREWTVDPNTLGNPEYRVPVIRVKLGKPPLTCKD
jgi:hypothetical protein